MTLTESRKKLETKSPALSIYWSSFHDYYMKRTIITINVTSWILKSRHQSVLTSIKSCRFRKNNHISALIIRDVSLFVRRDAMIVYGPYNNENEPMAKQYRNQLGRLHAKFCADYTRTMKQRKLAIATIIIKMFRE